MTRQRSPRTGLTGNHGATNAAASTRSGWSAASSSPRWAPSDSDTTTARSVAVASSTASASPANSASAYCRGRRGRSDRPLPRGSNATTRKCRARYGIWAFQTREW